MAAHVLRRMIAQKGAAHVESDPPLHRPPGGLDDLRPCLRDGKDASVHGRQHHLRVGGDSRPGAAGQPAGSQHSRRHDVCAGVGRLRARHEDGRRTGRMQGRRQPRTGKRDAATGQAAAAHGAAGQRRAVPGDRTPELAVVKHDRHRSADHPHRLPPRPGTQLDRDGSRERRLLRRRELQQPGARQGFLQQLLEPLLQRQCRRTVRDLQALRREPGYVPPVQHGRHLQWWRQRRRWNPGSRPVRGRPRAARDLRVVPQPGHRTGPLLRQQRCIGEQERHLYAGRIEAAEPRLLRCLSSGTSSGRIAGSQRAV